MAWGRARGRESAEYDDNNPYYPRHKEPGKRWYKKPIVWVAIIVILLLGYLLLSGKLSWPGGSGSTTSTAKNQTVKPTVQEQLTNYVISQQNKGVNKVDVQAKLQAVGYSEAQITRAFELSDPLVQFIISEEKKGKSKAEIIDELLAQGQELTTIQAKFAIVEKDDNAGAWPMIQKYWWAILIGGGIAWYLYNKYGADTTKRAPKVYTCEECREYAEEKLNEKKIHFNPSHRYKNRPELKQYRFCFEEPIFEEFNHHGQFGHKAGGRQYYMIAVGYDKELVEFIQTHDDVEVTEWIYGNAKPTEVRAVGEYARLRERSEMPIEDKEKMDQQEKEEWYKRWGTTPRPTGYPRHPYKSPGPIEGYESER
jgi:hypothetical protein